MPPFDDLLPRASTDLIEIRSEILRFLRNAQEDPTLSPQVFDAWMARLFPSQRALAREEVGRMLSGNWPPTVQFPNVIELVQGIRARRERRGLNNDSCRPDSNTEEVAEGPEEAMPGANDNAPCEEHDHALDCGLEHAVEDLLVQGDDQLIQDDGDHRELGVLLALVIFVATLPTLALLQALTIVFMFLCYFSHHR
ncbi:unnamed protein product [Alternaria alternata]|jgi:hypothetical protein